MSARVHKLQRAGDIRSLVLARLLQRFERRPQLVLPQARCKPREHEGTNVARSLELVNASAHSTSVVFVLSDFHDRAALPAIARCAARHDVALLQLIDPAEHDALPGFVDAVEAETGARSLRFAGASLARSRDEFLTQGLDPLPVRTDAPFVASIRRYLASRGGGTRRAR
jgi:hypothetical protein